MDSARSTVLDDYRGCEEVLGIGLLLLSFLTAATSYRRWSLDEKAMRLEQPLPSSRLPLIMSVGVALVALVATVVFVIDAM